MYNLSLQSSYQRIPMVLEIEKEEKIEELQKNFRLLQAQNHTLQENLEHSKEDRKLLHQQLHGYREREKLSLLREQRDFQRIIKLEEQMSRYITSVTETSNTQRLPQENSERLLTQDSTLPLFEGKFLIHQGPEDDPSIEIRFEDSELQELIDNFLTKRNTELQDSSWNTREELSTARFTEKKDSEEKDEYRPNLEELMAQETLNEVLHPSVDTSSEESSEILDADATTIPPLSLEEDMEEKTESPSMMPADDTIEETAIEETVEPSQTIDSLGETVVIEETSEQEEMESSSVASQNIEVETQVGEALETTSAVLEPSEKEFADAQESLVRESEQELSSEEKINQYFNAGLEASKAQNYREAIENFLQVTQLLPEAAPSYLNLAILHYRLGSYLKSQEFAKTASRLGSESAKQLLEKIDQELDQDSDLLL